MYFVFWWLFYHHHQWISSLHLLHARSFVYRPLYVLILRTLTWSFLLKIDIQQFYHPQTHLLSAAFSHSGIVGLVIHMLLLWYTERRTCWVLPDFQVACKDMHSFQGGINLPAITWYWHFETFLSCRFHRLFIVISIKHINNSVRISEAVKKCNHVNIC